MKQIFNWTVGSFFRTIGRIIAFFVVGTFVAYLLARSNIDWGKLNIFSMKIKASTFYNHWGGDIKTNNTNWSSGVNAYYQQYSYQTYTSYDSHATWTSTFDQTNEYIKIYGYFYNIDFDPSEMECLNTDCTIWQENNYKKLEFQVWLGDKSRQCKIDYNIPNISNATSDYIFWEATCTGLRSFNTIYYRLNVIDANTTAHTYNLGLNKVIYYSVDNSSSITNSINQQTQQQQQQHNETMSYLEDTNSTSTENSANNFFGNFSTTDSGGLSSIITAPLVMVNKMLDGQCVMPSATWKGATISLPCGDLLWSREGASDLRNLLNVFYGGFICYYAIRKLFLMIEGMKDPTSDRIEVSDL